MYFPFLRGKQYELIALREISSILSENNIIPIIEPVKLNTNGLVKAIKNLKAPEKGFIIIVNPSVGDWKKKYDSLIDILNSIKRKVPLISKLPPIIYGIILNDSMTINDVSKIIGECKDYNIAFIHNGFKNKDEIVKKIEELKNTNNRVAYNIFIDNKQSSLYRKSFSKLEIPRVKIQNSFEVQTNALYPDDEYFSDLHAIYSTELSMDGFGDYQIVGDQYSDNGGPAYAVAIHITYISDDEEMYVKHFKSDDNSTSKDPGGKFFQALEKLIEFNESNPGLFFQSSGLEQFKNLYKEKHFPGLGVVKKLSIMHHIELINDYIKRVD